MTNVISNYFETEGGFAQSPMWSVASERPIGLTAALDYLLGGQSVVYAMRMPDGVIKVGVSVNLANRSYQLHGQILGFRLGTIEDERELHARLKPYRARGREYYKPAPAVMNVVNELRDEFGLPHLAA